MESLISVVNSVAGLTACRPTVAMARGWLYCGTNIHWNRKCADFTINGCDHMSYLSHCVARQCMKNLITDYECRT